MTCFCTIMELGKLLVIVTKVQNFFFLILHNLFLPIITTATVWTYSLSEQTLFPFDPLVR